MIRIEIALRFSLFLGLAVPAVGRTQDIKPVDPSAPAPKEVTAPDLVTTPSGATLTVNRSITVDPTSAEVDGDDPESNTSRTTRRQNVTAFRPARIYWKAEAFTNHFDALESKFGLILATVDDVLRSQLEVPKGQGVVVVEVKPGSLAEQAGLKPRDILLSLGDKTLAGVGQARATLMGLGREALEVKLIREGKPRRMSLVGPEHGFTPASPEFWIGVPVSPVDAVLRSHLTELPAEAGLIANDVVKDSPADKAGVKKNDILVSMGGKPLKSSETLIAQVQASGGKPVPLVVLRAGKPTTIEVTPTRRAHEAAITLTLVPGHQQLQYRLIQPQVAIEVQKKLHDLRLARPPGSAQGRPDGKENDIEIELFANKSRRLGEDVDAAISAQIKELTAKIDDLRKAIEGLKKPEAK